MKILIADDHTLFRDTLFEYFKRAEPTADVTMVKDFYGAMESLEQHNKYDLILLDLQMPGMNGVSGFQEIHEKFPGHRVALMSGTADSNIVQQALDAGAVAYFPKTLSGKAMMSAIELVLSGQSFIPYEKKSDEVMESFYADPGNAHGSSSQSPPTSDHDFKLTPRENEVLAFLAKGASNKEIANALELQIVTIKLHVRGICRKLEVKNRTQAALKAKEFALVE